MQLALQHDAAPMRIPFNRIHDAPGESEASHNALWLQSLNRFKVMAEAEHRKREHPHRRQRWAALSADTDACPAWQTNRNT